MKPVNWIVTQIGSRERYAVPRAFEARGNLQHFYTDIWSDGTAGFAKYLPRGDGFAQRFHPALPRNKVTSFNLSGIYWSTRSVWRGKPKTVADQYLEHAWIGRHFAQRVNKQLARTKFDPSATAAFLFTTGALETCQYFRSLNVPIVVDQIDPARTEEQMVREETQRWPGWEEFPGGISDKYFERLEEEWNLADLVLVNSNWSRSALLKQGADARKIIVVPLCYEKGALPVPPPRERSDTAPLNVLFLGQIILRKGIPYLFEAAAKLIGSNVKFVVAGRVGVSDKAIAAAPPNISILGRRHNHAETARLYSEADLFVLPTISDGFALTQIEAMAFGLPVIATPNCGDVVTHGLDGLIVPPRDSQALADAIASLEADRRRLREMSAKAMQTVSHRRFSLDGYADAVEQALDAIRGNPVAVR